MPTYTDRAHATTIDPAHLPSLIAGHRTALVFVSASPCGAAGAEPGETVYIDAGQVCAGARIERIDHHENLTMQDLRLLREMHGSRTVGSGSAWTDLAGGGHAVVVWLTEVRPILDRSGVPTVLRSPSHEPWRTLESATTGGQSRAA
jgi:hypothetical protein